MNFTPTEKHYIYLWIDPSDCSVFYVGQGTNNIKNKYYRAYAKHGKGKNLQFCQKKFNSIIENGKTPIIMIYKDDLTQKEVNALEIQLIKKFGKVIDSTGTLYNISDGGDFNPMSIEYIRKKHSDIINSNEYHEKLRNSMKDVFTDEYRRKQSILSKSRNLDLDYKKRWYDNFIEKYSTINQIVSQ